MSFIMLMPLSLEKIIGTMEMMVVRVVIRIGRRRVVPASTSASPRGMVCRSWLVPSTR